MQVIENDLLLFLYVVCQHLWKKIDGKQLSHLPFDSLLLKLFMMNAHVENLEMIMFGQESRKCCQSHVKKKWASIFYVLYAEAGSRFMVLSVRGKLKFVQRTWSTGLRPLSACYDQTEYLRAQSITLQGVLQGGSATWGYIGGNIPDENKSRDLLSQKRGTL